MNLGGRFLVVTNSTLAAETDYSSVTLHFGSKDYPYGGKREGQSPLPDSIYTVVPDEAVESLEGQEKKVVYVLEQKQYDAEGLQEDLTLSLIHISVISTYAWHPRHSGYAEWVESAKSVTEN